MLGSFVDVALTAKFHLDQPKTAIPQMDDGIRFKTIAVSIVVELASEQGSVHTQIPIAHRLEEKAECLEIVNQILWPKAERGCGY